MSEKIVIPLKKGFHTDIVKPILRYLDSVGHYGSSSKYHGPLNEIQKLRIECIDNCTEPDQKSLDSYQGYADEIIALDLKLPLTENQIRIKFKWQEAFPSSKIKKSPTLVMACGVYEKACVLYNLAAIDVAVSQQQNTMQDEGLKTAAKLLQQASGIYTYLRATSRLTFGETDCTSDLHPDCLGALASLTLAMAQDMFVRKAAQDAMKDGLVAKLSQQCSLLYEETFKQLQAELPKLIFNKNWSVICNAKKIGFQAVAYYYEGRSCNGNKNFAESLARFRQAKDTMNQCQSACSIKPFPFAEQQKLIVTDLTKAEKENSFIFQTGVPDSKKLPTIEKAVLAKPIPVEGIKFSSDSKELLDNLLPWNVQQAAMRCEEKGIETVQLGVSKLKEASKNLNSILINLNLPVALEDMVGKSLPKSLCEKASMVRSLGGAQHLERLISELPTMVQKCKMILDQCDRSLMEEEMEDRKLRRSIGNQRSASEVLNAPFKEEIRRNRAVVMEAARADSMVKQKYSPHKMNIQLLSESESEIARNVPENKITKTPDLNGKKFVGELVSLMKQVEQLKNERKNIEEKFKNTKIDAGSKFMVHFKKIGALYEETASREELDKAFGKLKEASAKSLSDQERVLKQIQTSTHELNKFKSENNFTNPSRDAKTRELSSAYDVYMDLHATTKEGNKFYNDFILVLEKFQAKVSQFCNERAEEKADLMHGLPSLSSHPAQFNASSYNAFSAQTLYTALPTQNVITTNRPPTIMYGNSAFNPYTVYMPR